MNKLALFAVVTVLAGCASPPAERVVADPSSSCRAVAGTEWAVRYKGKNYLQRYCHGQGYRLFERT